MSAPSASTSRPVVVKVGTSSLVHDQGALDTSVIAKLAGEVAAQMRGGRRVVVVSSGAVAVGRAASSVSPSSDPTETRAMSAIGQPRLMRAYEDAFKAEGLLSAQVLISLRDFGVRRQYLRARETIEVLWSAAAVPIVNENDALLDREVRFGDNDRLAALVANLVGAEVLVILTDTPGLYDADPRRARGATLVEEVAASDAAFDEVAGGPGSPTARAEWNETRRGGLAAWSGVRAVIAQAARIDVIADAVDGKAGIGTTILARSERLPARKAWIAFALPARGRVVVDDGARRGSSSATRRCFLLGCVASRAASRKVTPSRSATCRERSSRRVWRASDLSTRRRGSASALVISTRAFPSRSCTRTTSWYWKRRSRTSHRRGNCDELSLDRCDSTIAIREVHLMRARHRRSLFAPFVVSGAMAIVFWMSPAAFASVSVHAPGTAVLGSRISVTVTGLKPGHYTLVISRVAGPTQCLALIRGWRCDTRHAQVVWDAAEATSVLPRAPTELWLRRLHDRWLLPVHRSTRPPDELRLVGEFREDADQNRRVVLGGSWSREAGTSDSGSKNVSRDPR